MSEPHNYAVVTVSKITGYSFHGDFVLTKDEAQTIADQLNVEWPDFIHTIKRMNQLPATYTATKAPPTEPTGYTAIGRAVFALYGDDVSVLICECHSPRPAWRGLTYNQACEMAEKIAAMLNGQAI